MFRAFVTRSRLMLSGVAVEKLPFRQNSRHLGDRKCLTNGDRRF
jgi:hypothetical protein